MKATVKMILASGLSFAVVNPALFADDNKVEKKVESAADKIENKVDQALGDAQTAVYDLADKDITAVSFAKNSSKLSKAEVRSLQSVYKSVLSDDTVDKVIVAAWADEPMPAGGKLSDAQVDLAEKRADAIEDVLEKMGNKNIDTYNMAKDASWIGKVFETQNAEIKGAMKGTPADDPNANRIAQLLESKGGVSKAVLIVKRTHASKKAAMNR